jgi:hypothetical protein
VGASPHDDAQAKPFQFRLQSLFVATFAVAVALGFLKWLGPVDFLWWATLLAAVNSVVAILIASKGSAWPGVFVGGVGVAFFVMTINLFESRFIATALLSGSLAAVCGGAFASDAQSRRSSRFLRWNWRIAVALICVTIVLAICIVAAVVLSVTKYGMIPRPD